MKKSIALIMAFAAVSVCPWTAVTPAWAGDEGLGSCAKNTVMLPVKAASVSTGLLVGIPIAVLRRTANRCHEYVGAFADKIGGKDSGPANIFASVAAIPFGLLVGTEEGVYEGSKNAIQSGVEKPFSLDSLSLGEMEEH